ncbi:hypothetical protein D3C72_2558850 [compost metagenome]
MINTEDHGNVKIISFNPHVEWGGLVNVYLDRPSVHTCVGSFYNKGDLVGGALIVEKTGDAVTEYDENDMPILK